MTRILVINGHPDPRSERLIAALCQAYAEGASSAGHEIRRLAIGELEFPLIREADAFITGPPPANILGAQRDINWAQHLVIAHPLWLGGAPALLKGFLEQTFRYGFTVPNPNSGSMRGLLRGRSARLIVTMGMPAAAYQLIFGAFGVRTTERSILRLCGFAPVRHTLLGGVGQGQEKRMIAAVRRLGGRAG